MKQWVFLTESPWLWIFPALCLLSFVLCSWAELRKRRAVHAWLRIALLFFAHAALLLAALRPATVLKREPNVAILLQENASRAQLDSLHDHYPEARVFTLRHEAATDYIPVPHASYLQQHLSAGSTVFLLGGGLSGPELKYLEPYRLHFMPIELPKGLLELSFTQRLQLSDTLRVNGVGKAAGDSLWLRLSLAGKGIDSLIVTGTELFHLKALPAVSGLLEYRLDLLNLHFDTLEYYPLLVDVAKNKKLRMALLGGYPSFEFRHLKNWLSGEGHGLYYQAEMAPGRYNREWLNMPDNKPTGLNQELLESVDMLIMDQQYWNKLNNAAIGLVEEAVKNRGIGCLVLMENGLWRPADRNWKSLPSLQVHERLQAAPAGHSLEGTGPPIAYYGAETKGWLPLLPGNSEGPMVVFRQEGLGRIGASLIQNTYTLLLQDQESAYSSLWTRILNSLLKAEGSSPVLEAEFPVFVGKKHQLQWWQPKEEVPELVMTDPDGREQLLPVMEDLRVPGLWHGFFWPSQPGRHSIKMQENDSLTFTVFPSGYLAALQQFQDTKETYTFVASKWPGPAASINENGGQCQLYSYQEASLLWFYGLFLCSMAGLWIVRKLGSL